MDNILNKIDKAIENDNPLYAENKSTEELFSIGGKLTNATGYKLYSLIDDTGQSDFKISTEKLLQDYNIVE